MRIHFRGAWRGLVCATVVLLVACGGGGGGTSPAAAGSGSTSCPTYTAGNKFVYSHTSVTTASGVTLLTTNFNRTVIVTNAASGVADMTATFSNSVDVDMYYHESTPTRFALKKTMHTAGALTDSTTFSTPFQFCVQPAVGDIYTGNVIYSNGGAASAKSQVTAVATVSVTVPAGTYASARRIDYLTKFYDGTGAYISGGDITTSLWFDSVVGVVKEVTTKSITVSGIAATLTNTASLQSFP